MTGVSRDDIVKARKGFIGVSFLDGGLIDSLAESL
jgi:hypothetical protein